jgi:hypothetical protein
LFAHDAAALLTTCTALLNFLRPLRGRLIGRTPDFESGYRGSSPRPGAKIPADFSILPPMATPNADSALDDALISVWRQTLVEQKMLVTAGDSTFRVRRTSKHGLAQVDFELNGLEFRGLEQNPQTKSRWAAMARDGAKVMQFLQGGRYIAVVTDGALKHYRSTPVR